VEKRYDVFLAFGGADRELATEVRRRLVAIGWAAFCDADLAPGATWVREIPEAMEVSRAVVLLKPRQDRASPWLDSERTRSINGGAAGTFRFIPFRPNGSPPGGRDEYGEDHLVWGEWWDDDAARTALAVDAALRHELNRGFFPNVPVRPEDPGVPPLRPHLHLDRVAQWSKLRDLCGLRRPACFVVHGAPGQYLEGFLERVRAHLADDVDQHEVIVVSTDALFQADVSAEGWQGRVVAALGGGDPVATLRTRSKARSVMLMFGTQPVRPARFAAHHTRSWEAFETWARAHLAELIRAAGVSHPLRLILAVEEPDGSPWSGRFEAALGAGMAAAGAAFAQLRRVRYPSLDDVRDYVDLLGLFPPDRWWEELHGVYADIEAGSGDYRALADEIERLVEELQRGSE
jgi:hypothetical protein